MHTTSIFKQYKYMNNICVYFIQTYEKYTLHNYYYHIVTHKTCDGIVIFF
jgi:hypothetical protein